MNKLLKFKAVKVLRNNHNLAQLYVCFRINYKFSIMTGLNEAEESRNDDLDFEGKNKWKFIKSQIVLLPVMKLFRELLAVIDTFNSRHRLYDLPIYSFQR